MKTNNYTPDQLKQTEEMASKGISDGIIAKKTGIGRYTVAQLTTAYWNKKMEQKTLKK